MCVNENALAKRARNTSSKHGFVNNVMYSQDIFLSFGEWIRETLCAAFGQIPGAVLVRYWPTCRGKLLLE